MQSVVERREYALGTVSAAIPITAGSSAVAMAISLPLRQNERLLAAVVRIRSGMAAACRFANLLYQYLKNHSL
ncbi:hypothetical protein ACWDZ6_04195 [Streptomyces sp. NPDC002926]